MSFIDNCNSERNIDLKKVPVAIVTGGAGEGIGHGITEALLSENWNVLVVDRDEKQAFRLQKTLAEKGKAIEVMVTDIASPDAGRRAVETALGKFGQVNGLVNSAGVGLCKPLAEVTDEEFDYLMNVDFRAAFRFSRAVIPEMLPAGGSIVNIGSVHADRTIRGYGLYGSLKAALEGLARGIAVDYGAQGIRANCVHPGLVMSPQNRALIQSFAPDPDAWVEGYIATKQLIPSLVAAKQVGELVAWLLSPKAAMVTGQAITIDGGSSAMLFEREKKS